MFKVYVKDSMGTPTVVDVVAYQQKTVGIEKSKELWPETYCIVCGQGCYASGLYSPYDNFTARFSHIRDPKNPELCPLSTKSKRFGSLARAESNAAQAAKVKKEFLQFESLKRAYLVCRKLRGGQGKLSQDDFLKMVKVADSVGIWGYSYMPQWGIPLLLMLMDNHPTPNGKAAFFYTFKKDRSHFNPSWWSRNVRLEAHWVSDGSLIETKADKNPAFLTHIPFSASVSDKILSGENVDWYTSDKLKILQAYSDEEANFG
ncbi:hypothetical protein [Serratia ficaria]|uniref:hypothetical protein n=1 Tax=Serratia ficaria TaxID=61651 RepID=UPI0021828799|nr:hypothetical protein [Serratia ficaria]CAI2536009.1 Uncharacterised protein [Serratia ficaria]